MRHNYSDFWKYVTKLYLNIIAPICILEVPFLGFCQFPLQAFFGRGASQFTPCVPPVPGPVVLDGVASRRGVVSAYVDHHCQQVVDGALVLPTCGLIHRVTEALVYDE